ncbi:MAG: hypothetical protein RIM23_20735 [Coleofasciculus sp. G3-WIS-01]|uniref:hypothetical protein n=1 Tax=Coleofasciculus sp. G3-WIS-01 TaxID=3069528 RepID=UPI0033033A24
MMTTETETMTAKLMTGTPVPELEVKTLDGKLWKLSEQKPQKLTGKRITPYEEPNKLIDFNNY